jgi:hypothetical protein
MRKLNNKRRKEDIIRLRGEGKSYRDIQKILGCSKSTIAYHCDGGKEKARVLLQLKSRKSICRKVSSFKVRCSKSNYRTLRAKVKTFKRKNTRPGNRTNIYVNNISKNYTCRDVVSKIGENPICYLTGKAIDLNKPETYNLDHIIPTAKGGTNDLKNLEICTKDANQAKGDLTLDQLYKLCENIISWKRHKEKLS